MQLKGTEKISEVADMNDAINFLGNSLSSIGVVKVEYLKANKTIHFDKGKDE